MIIIIITIIIIIYIYGWCLGCWYTVIITLSKLEFKQHPIYPRWWYTGTLTVLIYLKTKLLGVHWRWFLFPSICPIIFQHIPGTYPRPRTNSLWRNSFHLGVWAGLGYAPGVCWGSLRICERFCAQLSSQWPTGELLLQGYDLQVAPQLHGIAFEMKETNPLLQQNRVKTKGESAVLFWDLFNPCRYVFKTQFGTWTPLFFLVRHVFVSVFGGNESHQQENWTQKRKQHRKEGSTVDLGHTFGVIFAMGQLL